MLSQFGIEASRAAQYVIAFAIILVLVALFGLVLRKLTGGRLMMNGQDRSRARQPRLGVVDIYDLDRQRRLVLLRRDNVEHLLLIGGLNDVVIETNIVRVAGARIPATSVEPGAERFEPAFEPTRPQVETPGRPSIETQLAAQLGSFVRRPSDEAADEEEPSYAPRISPQAPGPVEPELRAEASGPAKAPPSEGRRTEPHPAPFQDISAGPRSNAEAPPVRMEPRPTYFPPIFQSRPTPQPPAPQPPAPQPPPAPAPPVSPTLAEPSLAADNIPGERDAPDARVLSNMAKQLEEALKRPATPVSAERDQADLASAAIEDNPDIEDDLLEPEVPASEVAEVGTPVIINDEIAIADENVVPVEPHEQPATPRPASEPDAGAPPPKADKDKVPDPFSVEEIEAEFARLLGRPLDTGKKG